MARRHRRQRQRQQRPREEYTVICMPWSQEAMGYATGNKLGSCSDCSARIVVGPQAQALPSPRLLCLACGRAQHPDVKAQAVPGDLDAIERRFGRDARKRAEGLTQIPLAKVPDP